MPVFSYSHPTYPIHTLSNSSPTLYSVKVTKNEVFRKRERGNTTSDFSVAMLCNPVRTYTVRSIVYNSIIPIINIKGIAKITNPGTLEA